MKSVLFAAVLLIASSAGFDPPLGDKLKDSFHIGSAAEIPDCKKDDWKTVLSNVTATKEYFCVKLNVNDGAVARGLITKDDVIKKFGWSDPPATGCKGGLTYNTSVRTDELKGELCLCSTEKCNSAGGLQINPIAIVAAGVVAIARLVR